MLRSSTALPQGITILAVGAEEQYHTTHREGGEQTKERLHKKDINDCRFFNLIWCTAEYRQSYADFVYFYLYFHPRNIISNLIYAWPIPY